MNDLIFVVMFFVLAIAFGYCAYLLWRGTPIEKIECSKKYHLSKLGDAELVEFIQVNSDIVRIDERIDAILKLMKMLNEKISRVLKKNNESVL